MRARSTPPAARCCSRARPSSSRCSACSSSASASSTASRSPRRIVVLTVMTAAVTLIPALLGMFGMRVLSRKERRRLAAEGPRDPKLDGIWPRWAAYVQKHPKPLAAGALIFMLVLAIPVLSLRLGSSDAGQDPPSSTTRKAYELLAKGFGAGFNGTFQVVAKTPNGKADLPKVQKLADALGRDRRARGGRPAGAVAQRQDRADRGAADHGAAGRGDQPADRHAARRRRPPERRRPGGLRRRDHRDLRRLRRGADRQAAAVHRGDRAARLPAAHDRVPEPADPGHRGGDEPARGRRLVRRRHRGLPEGLARRAARRRAPARSRRSSR